MVPVIVEPAVTDDEAEDEPVAEGEEDGDEEVVADAVGGRHWAAPADDQLLSACNV